MSRVAIVTGAARGIGRAVAERLAADGLDVALVDLDAARCDATAASVRSAGQRTLAIGGDISNEDDVAATLETVTAELGAPAVLVNSAGTLREGLATRTDLTDWQTLLDVNLTGTFLMSRGAAPLMRQEGYGRIINLSSVGARGMIGFAAYGAAKAGVEALTRTLAIELGRYGITVNAVAPGFIATDMNRELAERSGRAFEELEREMVANIPVGRSGAPEDIAQAVSFFADERSGFFSGQVVYAAGGPVG